jgi:Lyzozyme M1 (1,4-beta-N-acetylmuramidase)
VIKGQDWSGYQASQPSVNGLAFVFIKATEGTSYVNPHMVAQAAWARKHGLVVGFYHFARPGSMSEQASFFVEKAAMLPGDVLAVDWEDVGVSGSDKDALLKDVKALKSSHRVVLYCNQYFWLRHDSTSYAGDGLWIADYVTAGHPRIQDSWRFHQYSDQPLDEDIANFADVAALKQWANPTAVTHTVSLSHVAYAAEHDPKLAQGHTTHAADVKLVEHALNAEGLLPAKYASDGSFGTLTIEAYKKWQQRCGFHGSDQVDGIPGIESLTKLGHRHGFIVTK